MKTIEKLLNSLKKYFSQSVRGLKTKKYSNFIPRIYFLGLILGLILTLIYAFIPNFVTCSSLFGQKVCTPTGIFISLIISLPGYVISGNLIRFFPEPPWLVSLIIVIAVSLAFYYFVGLALDKIINKKLSYKSFVYYFILFTLLTLIFILLILLR